MEWNKLYKYFKTLNLLVLLVLISASYFLFGRSVSLGVVAGGVLIMGNFTILQHSIRKAFSSQEFNPRQKANIIMKYYLRLLCLGIIMFILIAKGWVHPIGLVIGLSTLVFTIICLGLSRSLMTNSKEGF